MTIELTGFNNLDGEAGGGDAGPHILKFKTDDGKDVVLNVNDDQLTALFLGAADILGGCIYQDNNADLEDKVVDKQWGAMLEVVKQLPNYIGSPYSGVFGDHGALAEWIEQHKKRQ